jgi:hypothetical protein
MSDGELFDERKDVEIVREKILFLFGLASRWCARGLSVVRLVDVK